MLSTVCFMMSFVYYMWFTVCCQPSAIYCLLSTNCFNMWSVVSCLLLSVSSKLLTNQQATVLLPMQGHVGEYCKAHCNHYSVEELALVNTGETLTLQNT